MPRFLPGLFGLPWEILDVQYYKASINRDGPSDEIRYGNEGFETQYFERKLSYKDYQIVYDY